MSQDELNLLEIKREMGEKERKIQLELIKKGEEGSCILRGIPYNLNVRKKKDSMGDGSWEVLRIQQQHLISL